VLTTLTLLVLVVAAGGHVAARQAAAPRTAGAFTSAGRMGDARTDHTATLLSDGRVLVVGGYDGNFDVAAAEVWDPKTGQFAAAGELAEPRHGHAAALLPDGRVLVVGGCCQEGDRHEAMGPVEIWDPAASTFNPAAPLSEDRSGHSMTVLSDGRMLVVGGDKYGNELDSAEIWEPATGLFGPAGLLADRRTGHTATLLTDGRVLITDGYISDGRRWAEIWDSATASFGPAPRLRPARDGHTITLLPDGRVLVAGGCCGNRLGTRYASGAVTWDLATGRSRTAGALHKGRYQHTATALPDGRVLVVGGWGRGDRRLASAEVWAAVRRADPGG
jgi:hypothetical protein